MPMKTGSFERFKNNDTGFAYDYRPLFTNEVYNGYFLSFPSRLSSAKNDQERVKIFNEARVATGLYCAVVYNLYPNSEALRQSIDRDPELSANFSRAMDFLGKHGGRETANIIAESIRKSLEKSGGNN